MEHSVTGKHSGSIRWMVPLCRQPPLLISSRTSILLGGALAGRVQTRRKREIVTVTNNASVHQSARTHPMVVL
eukprot:8705949-Pyramimonas_sp.AAC.1